MTIFTKKRATSTFLAFFAFMAFAPSNAFSSDLLEEEVQVKPSRLQEQLRYFIDRQQRGVSFDAPFEKEICRPFFQESLDRTQLALDKSMAEATSFSSNFSPSRQKELYDMLEQVSKKGHELFDAGNMDTYWNIFLHKMLAGLLSNVQDKNFAYNSGHSKAYGQIFFTSPDDFSIEVALFDTEHYLRLHHLEEVREHAVPYRDRNPSSFSKEDRGNEHENYVVIGADGKTYSMTPSAIQNSTILTSDCLWLPFVGTPEEVELSLEDLCESLIYRIGMVGIPTALTPFDGNLPAKASRFSAHDIEDHIHALFGAMRGQVIKAYDPKTDPLISIIKPVWDKIKTSAPPKARSLYIGQFFYGIHESGYSYENNLFYDEEGTDILLEPAEHYKSLQEFIVTTPPKIKIFFEGLLKNANPAIAEEEDEILHTSLRDFILSRIYNFYLDILELDHEVEAPWRTAGGEPLALESFPKDDVLRYLDEVAGPLFLDFINS